VNKRIHKHTWDYAVEQHLLRSHLLLDGSERRVVLKAQGVKESEGRRSSKQKNDEHKCSNNVAKLLSAAECQDARGQDHGHKKSRRSIHAWIQGRKQRQTERSHQTEQDDPNLRGRTKGRSGCNVCCRGGDSLCL